MHIAGSSFAAQGQSPGMQHDQMPELVADFKQECHALTGPCLLCYAPRQQANQGSGLPSQALLGLLGLES